MPRRNSNSKHAQRQAKGKMDGDSRNRGWEASLKAKAYRQRERQLKEPRLGSQLEGKGLQAKGAPTQGTRVEEPGPSVHQFLCTEEVGTPKGRALIGEKSS